MSRCKPSIYLYPITPYTFASGANDYILKKSECLAEDFIVVNSETRIGIVDILIKLFKTDVVYFNWIEDLADKSFGYIQVIVLFIILLSSRILHKKIVWFVHNNISHYPKNRWLKKVIRRMMLTFSDLVLTHSRQLDLYPKLQNITCFDHPVETREFVTEQTDPEYDLLIWGNQSYYKGIDELLQYNKTSTGMQKMKILIAGKFNSQEFYENSVLLQESNVTIINRIIEDDELIDLFSRSKYVLFCYRKNSVLSSAALSKSLSYGKTVIGPAAGAFKELGEKGLVFTYESFADLELKLNSLLSEKVYVDRSKILEYIKQNDWASFKEFLVSEIRDITVKKRLALREAIA